MPNLAELILKTLSSNQWSIFYKPNPLEKLKIQEGSDLYRINEVSITDFISAFNKALEESLENKEK